ncbi:MAG TPA: right-handed parallel beta-helix repeat-containing protein [Steroidobacteraceae bacterium]|nr:right-handed parallel beta-helix repeat-containing protein [Steroidobacteraceae bacterium]
MNSIATGNVSAGLSVEGKGPHVISGNKITGNGFGINVAGGSFQFMHNMVAGNDVYGFEFFDDLDLPHATNLLTLNDIVGNGVGLSINRTSAGVKVNKNNLYGNGTDGSNCAIIVSQNSADARNNYWGAPTGPGKDPADQVGQEPFCDGTVPGNDAGMPVTTPFSKDPFVIN